MRSINFDGGPMRRPKEIRARVETGSIGRKLLRPERDREDDDNLAVELHEFGVSEQSSVALQLAFLEDHILHTNTHTHTRTHTHTHARTHTHAHAHSRTHAYIHTAFLYRYIF